jgi:palmitoyl-protein thioesterase
MQNFAEELRQAFPGMYVRIVNIAEDLASDQRASFFGDVNEQVEKVCQDLERDPELRGGFDAVGFSQGGKSSHLICRLIILSRPFSRRSSLRQANFCVPTSSGAIVRAYVILLPSEVSIWALATSQHASQRSCSVVWQKQRYEEESTRNMLKGEIKEMTLFIMTDSICTILSHIVTAQYYRDPNYADRYEKYLTMNHFLTDINNEVDINEEYKRNIIKLDNLVLLMFDHDIVSASRHNQRQTAFLFFLATDRRAKAIILVCIVRSKSRERAR